MPAPKYIRRNPDRAPRPSTITIPERASPSVKLVFSEMKRLSQTYDAVEAGSGVNRPTIKAWRHRNAPTLTSISAVLGFLGWIFVPIPKEPTLPAEIVDELRPIAKRLDLAMPEAIRLIAEIAYRARRPSDGDPTPEYEKQLGGI